MTDSVGSSGRTPPKHLLIDRLFGQQAGAFTVPWVRAMLGTDYMIYMDPTAGDGVGGSDVATGDLASPQLVLKSLRHLRSRGVDGVGVLIEKNPIAFEKLAANLGDLPSNVKLLQADACEVVPGILRDLHAPSAAVNYIDDPNHSGDSTLTDDVISALFTARALTVFAAIGTNASGAARKEGHYEESLPRYLSLLDRANGVRDYRRQAVLCALKGDSHRWAYLVVGSDKFAGRVIRELQKTMNQVVVKRGKQEIRLEGEIYVGYDDVRTKLIQMHTRREK